MIALYFNAVVNQRFNPYKKAQTYLRKVCLHYELFHYDTHSHGH